MDDRTNEKSTSIGQVVGLVSTLGRVVKNRIDEFASEADEQLRQKLAEVKQDLEEEMSDTDATKTQASGEETSPESSGPRDEPPAQD